MIGRRRTTSRLNTTDRHMKMTAGRYTSIPANIGKKRSFILRIIFVQVWRYKHCRSNSGLEYPELLDRMSALIACIVEMLSCYPLFYIWEVHRRWIYCSAMHFLAHWFVRCEWSIGHRSEGDWFCVWCHFRFWTIATLLVWSIKGAIRCTNRTAFLEWTIFPHVSVAETGVAL